MADETHSVGEVWGKVEALERNFNLLGDRLDTGITSIGNLIRENQDKTDRRIDVLARDTQTRFENEARSYRQSSAEKSATALQVIGYALTALFGIGGFITGGATLAFSFYTLSKAPIDQAFADINTKVVRLQNEFTPKDQVKITEDLARKNQTDIESLDKQAAANTQARLDITKAVDALTSQVDILRTNSVSKGELALLNDRVSLVSNRVTPPVAQTPK